MKRKLRTIASMAAALVMAFAMSATALAYNGFDYEQTDSGTLILPHSNPDAGVSVTLYMYTDTSDRDIKSVENHYDLSWIERDSSGNVSNYYPLMFEFSPYDAQVYDTIGESEVWVWDFKLESGTYFIGWSNGYGSLPEIVTLTPEFEVITNSTEWPAFEEGDHVRLYAMYGHNYGDITWREDNQDAFISWAKETEAHFDSIEEGMEMAEAGNVEEISVEQEPEAAEEPTAEEPAEEAAPELAEAAEPAKEEGGGIPVLGIGIGVVVVLAVIAFVIGKRK